jgi:hypothetical protein
MFKNYLTQHLASTLERECRVFDLPTTEKNELLRCSTQMFNHFFASQQAGSAADRAKALFVAMAYLRDCREIVERAGRDPLRLIGRIDVLEGRFAQLFEECAKGEGGQFRMLG